MASQKKNSQIKKNNFKKTTHPFSESSKKENISFESKIVARFFVVASGKIQRRPFGNLATSHSRGDDVDVVVVVVDEVASSKRKCPKKNEFERKKRSSVPDPVPVSVPVPVNRRGRVLKKENHRNETKKTKTKTKTTRHIRVDLEPLAQKTNSSSSSSSCSSSQAKTFPPKRNEFQLQFQSNNEEINESFKKLTSSSSSFMFSNKNSRKEYNWNRNWKSVLVALKFDSKLE